MTHSLQIDSQHDVIAMDKLREIIDTAGLPQFHGAHLPKYMCFAYSREYMTCETNKVIANVYPESFSFCFQNIMADVLLLLVWESTAAVITIQHFFAL